MKSHLNHMKFLSTLLLSLLSVCGLRAANPAFKDLVWTNDPGTAHLRSNVIRLGFGDTNTFFYSDPSKHTVGVGYQIFQGGAADFNNTVFGHQAMELLTTGQENTAVGTFALNGATNSSWNTAIGYLALADLKKGSGNVGIGASVLENLIPTTVGDGTENPGENVGIGYQTGQILETGQKNIIIGPFANFDDLTSSNNIVLGHTAIGNFYDIVVGINAQTGSGATDSTNIVIGTGSRGRRLDLAIGHGVNIFSIGGRLNTMVGHLGSITAGKTNATGLGFKSSVGDDNTVQLGNGLTERVRTAGFYEATNGFSSYSTAVTNQIGSTGYTNNGVINQTVYVTATAVSFTVKNRAGTVLYTSPSMTATVPITLQPGWAVNAASGLTGTALPF